jgi:hypothetical protein
MVSSSLDFVIVCLKTRAAHGDAKVTKFHCRAAFVFWPLGAKQSHREKHRGGCLL